ncbi:hypothetical protein BJV74DRAFT_804620 [Russula compacta]|nr:hypothetical protein BJV74DRAFT_804620 [Russula compacta]
MSSITLARVYKQSFQAYPHGTLAAAGGALTASAMSSLSCHNRSCITPRDDRRQPYHYDIARTLRFFCFGAGISPVIGRWNKYLELKFPLCSRRKCTASFTVLSKRVVVDQIVMAPIGLSLFLSSMGVMEGRDTKHIRARFKDIYQLALLANWKIWPAAQFINFWFIPLPYRVPFQQTCGVFWTLYLSLLTSAENKNQKEEDTETL